MYLSYSEEHLLIQKAAKDFAQNELKPGVISRDSNSLYPKIGVKRMAELGFLGMTVSQKYGGGGMDTLSYSIAVEEISKVDNSCSVIMSAHNSLACWGIEEYGDDYQKDKYLKKLATGKTIGAFCLSEPESGSDATQQKTTAIKKGDYYLLNGTKNWITNGEKAGIYVVIAQSDSEKGYKGINAFIVEA
jgi:alkylation response protein AidB-like acyl-CoA dehydrogenase